MAERSVAITRVERSKHDRLATRVDGLDDVLRGGFVLGGTYLLSGPPGIGKSTLALQAAAGVAGNGFTTLYDSTELEPEEVRGYAERMGAVTEALRIMKEASLEALLSEAKTVSPSLVIVDSLKYLTVEGERPGSAVQLLEVCSSLKSAAKALRCAVLYVGHVVKDGTAAGPQELSHLVDCTLEFSVDGDPDHVSDSTVRTLATWKNRFGALRAARYIMTERGLTLAPPEKEDDFDEPIPPQAPRIGTYPAR